jgi:EpsI family protein
MLWSVLLTVFGRRAGHALVFPIAFLYFAVPVWDYLNGFLQAATTTVVGGWVSASGIPALIEGNFVTIPAGRFEIAAGCAGQAFFVTAGAIAALYGHLHYQKLISRLLLMFVAFVGAMAVNWIRVYLVIIAGHFTDMQHYLVRVDHYTFGWLIFAAAMIPFFWFALRLEQASRGQESAALASPACAQTCWVALIASVASLALPVWAWNSLSSRPAVAGTAPVLPAAPEGWQRVDSMREPDWRPDYERADDELWARFQIGQEPHEAVDLWIVYYASQRQGKELIYFANRVADSREWEVRRESRLRLDPPMREALIVNRAGDQRLVRWWYEIGGWNTTSRSGAKLRQVAARVTGRSEASLVAFSTPCVEACDDAADRLDTFSRAISFDLRAAVYSDRIGEPG